MSIIHLQQITKKLKELYSDKIDINDLSKNDKEIDTKLLSRSLAAFAIHSHFGCSFEESANSVVDGPDDNGIDAIYYSKSLKEIVFVQSKWIKSGSGEPESGEIAKFCRGIEDIFNNNYDRFNRKITQLEEIISSAISDYETKYYIILIYTGDKGLAKHSQRLIDDLLEKLNDAGENFNESLVNFKKIDQGKIYSILSKGVSKNEITFEIGLSQWGKLPDPYTAYYGYLSGEEIVSLWKDYGRGLFEKNIRNVLGTTDINDELILTIAAKPENFCYYNNGITIIADNIEKSKVGGTKRDFGSFKLTNASIVNGAQTISTIGMQSEKHYENIKKINVLTRVISLKNAPDSFGSEITKSNNRQNKIENRDFVSLETEQLRIKQELALDNINYNIIRSNSFIPGVSAFDLDEATMALACASSNISLAVQARREKSKIYENTDSGMYKAIFNPSVTGIYVFNCVKLFRIIDGFIKTELNSLKKKTGSRYGILTHGNHILAMAIFNKYLSLIKSNKDYILFEEGSIQKNLLSYLSVFEKYINGHSEKIIIRNIFINKTKCKEIMEKL